jgi:hypothetical protein
MIANIKSFICVAKFENFPANSEPLFEITVHSIINNTAIGDTSAIPKKLN